MTASREHSSPEPGGARVARLDGIGTDGAAGTGGDSAAATTAPVARLDAPPAAAVGGPEADLADLGGAGRDVASFGSSSPATSHDVADGSGEPDAAPIALFDGHELTAGRADVTVAEFGAAALRRPVGSGSGRARRDRSARGRTTDPDPDLADGAERDRAERGGAERGGAERGGAERGGQERGGEQREARRSARRGGGSRFGSNTGRGSGSRSGAARAGSTRSGGGVGPKADAGDPAGGSAGAGGFSAAGEAAESGSGRRSGRRSDGGSSWASNRPRGQQELDPDADPYAVARDICLRLLTDRSRTRQELAQALRRKGVPDDVAGPVLERYDEVGLIDDAAFAGQWVRSRHNHRGLARRAIAMELRRKGVDDDTAGEALAEVDPASEERRARELVDRKLRSLTVTSTEERAVASRRLVGMLARKGYPGGIAYRVVREALAAHGAEVDELDDAEPPDE